MIKQLTTIDLAYVAGFLDGDGSIFAQIIPRKQYRHAFGIRTTVSFHQKSTRRWFIFKLKRLLGLGNYRKDRGDGQAELAITGFGPVKELLLALYPYLRLKRTIAREVLRIIEDYEKKPDRNGFFKICDSIDKSAKLADGKKRKITASVVRAHWQSP